VKQLSSTLKKNWEKGRASAFSPYQRLRYVLLPGLPVVSGKDILKSFTDLGISLVANGAAMLNSNVSHLPVSIP
jgi:hypothetical protein